MITTVGTNPHTQLSSVHTFIRNQEGEPYAEQVRFWPWWLSQNVIITSFEPQKKKQQAEQQLMIKHYDAMFVVRDGLWTPKLCKLNQIDSVHQHLLRLVNRHIRKGCFNRKMMWGNDEQFYSTVFVRIEWCLLKWKCADNVISGCFTWFSPSGDSRLESLSQSCVFVLLRLDAVSRSSLRLFYRQQIILSSLDGPLNFLRVFQTHTTKKDSDIEINSCCAIHNQRKLER